MRIFILVLGVSFLMYSCHTSFQPTLSNYSAFETTFLDTLVVSSSKTKPREKVPEYNGSVPKTMDLLHTQLDLSFNWEKQMVIGQAGLLLKPYFYPQRIIKIDCINFKLDSLALMANHSLIDFDYTYDGKKLIIDPQKFFTPNDTLKVIIHYRVTPSSDENHQSNGDDKGLYFIQKDSLTKRRKEIWTLGETQWSAKWFPTINRPNIKATQSIFLTIDSALTSISNGVLISSLVNNNGTKTDQWELNQPQSPYLTTVIVGQFDRQLDSSGPVVLEYFVQPGFKNDISSIFGEVSEMIRFFSETFDYSFPWPNYKQIIVQDFVSGAMENTTAVIYGDFIQHHKEEIIGVGNDAIVAHELVHHWFGNLVTCENWANITLNEGFANFGEALWISNFYGNEAGEYHRYLNRQKYLEDAYLSGPLPVVSYYFSNPEKLFNTHTYNKGAAILHMLKTYLGDPGFFDGISSYLNEHEYSNTEIDHLRMSLEKISGLDLKQIFDQWFFQSGHPRISFQSHYDSTSSIFNLHLTQENAFQREFQDLFSFPLKIGYVINGDYKEYDFFMSKKKEKISLSIPGPPEFIILDPKLNVLAEYTVSYSLDQWEKIFSLPVNVGWKIRSFETILLLSDAEAKEKVIRWGLNSSPIFRQLALKAIEHHSLRIFEDTLLRIGTLDQRADIRAFAWRTLGSVAIKDHSKYLIKRLKEENSPFVLAELIKATEELNPNYMDIAVITSFENRPESAITASLGKVYSQRKAFDKISFFEEHLYTIKEIHSANFYQSYLSLFPETGLLNIYKIAIDSRNQRVRKYAATLAVYHLARVWTNVKPSLRAEAKTLLEKILIWEKDETLIDFYFAFK